MVPMIEQVRDDPAMPVNWGKNQPGMQARDDLKEPSIDFLLTLDDAAFRSFFSGSPVKRIGRSRFIRNVLIAAGNSGNPQFVERCKALAETDPSPEVRGMAAWASVTPAAISSIQMMPIVFCASLPPCPRA